MSTKEKAGLALGIGTVLGTGVVGTGALLGVGGLAIVANPFNMDFNSEEIHQEMFHGMSEGIVFFENLDIDFDGIAGTIEGDLGEFASSIDIPQIDFSDFKDELGDIFGHVA